MAKMIPKSLFIITCAFVFWLSCSEAASLGPEVAVLQIKIGKEKKLRRVVIGLYDECAPLTVASFKALIQKKYYNGMRFHRVFPKRLVQTGDPYSRHGDSPRSGTGGPGYTIPQEIRASHVRGAVAASRLEDDINPTRASNGSQFYICLESMPQLDGKYTVFGKVIEGIDVLDSISERTTNSNDFPLEKIVIQSMVLEPQIEIVAEVAQ